MVVLSEGADETVYGADDRRHGLVNGPNDGSYRGHYALGKGCGVKKSRTEQADHHTYSHLNDKAAS